MQTYKAGDRARIVEMPDRGAALIGQVVTVATWGGLGAAPDDVMVVTENGSMLFVKEHQLARVEHR